MKKITVFLTAALLAAGAQAVAADLQDWQSNAPKNVNALKAPVRVVNLWATWCGPCRKEMPEMSAWYQKQKKGSVDMVGIALDSSENIGRFLKTTPVRYPIWRYSGNDSRAWMKSFGNSIGGLPFCPCSRAQRLRGAATHGCSARAPAAA